MCGLLLLTGPPVSSISSCSWLCVTLSLLGYADQSNLLLSQKKQQKVTGLDNKRLRPPDCWYSLSLALMLSKMRGTLGQWLEGDLRPSANKEPSPRGKESCQQPSEWAWMQILIQPNLEMITVPAIPCLQPCERRNPAEPRPGSRPTEAMDRHLKLWGNLLLSKR